MINSLDFVFQININFRRFQLYERVSSVQRSRLFDSLIHLYLNVLFDYDQHRQTSRSRRHYI